MVDQRRNQQSQISFLLEQKRKIQLEVRQRFSRYGDETVETIEEAAVEAHGLVRLLEKMGLPPTPHFDRQLDLINRFLSSNSPDLFLRKAKHQRMGEDSVRRWKVKTARQAGPDPLAGWVGPLFDEKGEYIGPERRSGAIRRKKNDRRRGVETISQNFRFGGERRKKRGRRKTDRLR